MCPAVPFTDHEGRLPAALSVTGSKESIDHEYTHRMIERLWDTAEAIEAQLWYS